MSEQQNYEREYLEYIRQYIAILTEGREEFFLSLCDIEEDILNVIDKNTFSGYEAVVVDRRDCSEAVRLRNNTAVNRIVLLSGEGVRQIDSLKDFNEYSILSEDVNQVWSCLERVFQLELEPKVRVFLGAILEQNEVTLGNLIEYMKKSMVRGRLVPMRLNQNLPMLGIWKSDEKEVLGKGVIKRMMRASKYSIVESRLSKAVIDRKINDAQKVRKIRSGLAEGDIQKILSALYYKDVKDYFKTVPREKPGEEKEEHTEEAVPYEFSYEYKLQEDTEEEIEAIEERWMKEREEDTEDGPDWERYLLGSSDEQRYRKQRAELLQKVEDANLPLEKRQELQRRLESFLSVFERSWQKVQDVTPICLNSFCEAAESYTQEYFSLLSVMILDEALRGTAAGALREIIEGILLLFCEEEEEQIVMPYYHPVVIFYYKGLCEQYENILLVWDEEETAFCKEQLRLELVKKLQRQFPIEFLLKGNNRYVLDNTTVGQPKLFFANASRGAVYSVLDFRVVQRQILDYIYQHAYMTEMTICLLDISELTGLKQLLDRIHRYVEASLCNIGRLDFLIISEKEEELKQELSAMWEVIGMDTMVRFRFARREYMGASGYDIERMAEEADLFIIGDNAMLYAKPQLVQVKAYTNAARIRLQKMNLKQQIARYYRFGRTDVEILWGTLQKMALDGQEGFFRWRNKKLEDSMITFVNRKISENPYKTIVLLSSNEEILSEIFRTEYIHAYRKKYNGKSISLLEFDQKNKESSIPDEGEPRIRCSLMEFYSDVVGSELMRQMFPGISDINLTIFYKNGRVNCKCLINAEEEEELGYPWEEYCKEWLLWQMGELLDEKNILADYFRELWLSYLQENAASLSAILLAEKLCQGNEVELSFGTRKVASKMDSETREPEDCMEALKLHEMFVFLDRKKAIDELTVKEFLKRYTKETLDRLLACPSIELLEEGRLKSVYELQKMIRGR